MHPTIPKKFGVGDSIMLTTHELDRPWYALRCTPELITFNPKFRAPRGNIVVTPQAQEFARAAGITARSLLIEPNIKGMFSSTNKAWPFERWQEVVKRVGPDFDLVQAYQPDKPVLERVRVINTRSVWDAVAILAFAAGVVTTEGALHHAAGALHKPAVVVWTAYSDPAILGYPDHVNLYHPDPRGLGQRLPCHYCRESAEKISVDDVVNAIRETFLVRVQEKPGLDDPGTSDAEPLPG